MENYQKLKEVIQAANPEIMELKFGCEVQRDEEVLTFISDYYFEGIGDRQWKKVTLRGEAGNVFEMAEMDLSKYKVLGRPIRLADVLLAMIAETDRQTTNKEIRKMNYSQRTLKILAKWNLKDDNLDHHSDEIKQFLIDLLVTGSQ